MAVYKNANFSTRLRVKVLLKLGMQADLTIYPALSSKPCNQRSVCAGWALSSHALLSHLSNPNRMSCYRTLTDVYDGVRFGRIALQYPQGKADQQQVHLGISARRLIQALLGYPIPSKWSTQIKKKKKKKERDDQYPVQKQNRGPPSWQTRLAWNPADMMLFFSHSLAL